MAKVLQDAGFVHLHTHSSYSLLASALRIADLHKLALADRMPALALTDVNNMFGALEFSEKLAQAGIQPIVGMQVSVAFDEPRTGRGEQRSPAHPGLVLLATCEEGYANLIRLASEAHLRPASGEPPHLTLARLLDSPLGLIALTGGPSGPIDCALADGKADIARERLERLQGAFGDRLYVEIQRHGLPQQREVEPGLLDLAYALGLPLVAANQPVFAKAEDYEAHDALLCIAEGRLVSEDDRRRLTPEHRFKSRREMATLFADLPEAVSNTAEVAMRCGFRPRTRKPILPRFAAGVVDGEAAEASELRRQAVAGLEARLHAHPPAEGHSAASYAERLDFELGVIDRMGFPGYFLIVADFIKWAKLQDIAVGPGRGSGAGSLVAYALTITDLDPLRFGLFFERFLNPERVSMPDFDIDFCQERRDEVIAYVQARYGRDRVAQIITFGTLQARGVLRDVGRVLQMPYGQVDKLCKLVPVNPAHPVTLAEAIEGEPKLRAAADEEPVVARLLKIARKLEGLHRHASTHAAGIVIGERPLDQLVPLYRDPKSDMPVTQFNMKWVEPAGLVKFDFLGLKTLTVLRTAVALLKQRGVALDLGTIPLDDAKSYELMARGETVGLFQVESAGMRKALVEMRPNCLEDIIALVALYRPGPMANIPVYCARKHGQERVEYIHPRLEPFLKETFGIITYQEQVMQIARDLAGYSLGEADMLRRAMGKKIKSEMDAQRARFVTGAVERGVPKAVADEVFDACAKFADYGFNKGHSAPYALITYQTAYLKANYPVEFLAALMTHDIGNTDKLAEFRADAQRLGLKVELPSVNRSGVLFEVHEGAIRYALAALKGVGPQAVESVVEARRTGGPFRDLADFAHRLNARLVNKRTVEALAAGGAFDELESDRARANACADQILALGARAADNQATGQDELFGGSVREPLRCPLVEPWTLQERLQREFGAAGFYLSGHPLDEFAPVLKRMNVQRWVDFSRSVRAGAAMGRLAATVLSKSERRTKSGNKMGIVCLSDPSGQFEAILFSEALAQYRDLLEQGRSVVVLVGAALDGDEVRARIQTVEPLDTATERHQTALRVFLRDETPLPSILERLRSPGDGEVSLIALLGGGQREVEIRLPGRFKTSPGIVGALRAVPGVVEVEAA